MAIYIFRNIKPDMKVSAIQSLYMPNIMPALSKKVSNPIAPAAKKTTASSLELCANYNKHLVNFKGYYGDSNPAKKLFWILKGNSDVYEDQETYRTLYKGGNTGWKKWVNENRMRLKNTKKTK